MSDQPSNPSQAGPRIESATVVVRFVPDFSDLDSQIEQRVREAVSRLGEGRKDEPHVEPPKMPDADLGRFSEPERPAAMRLPDVELGPEPPKADSGRRSIGEMEKLAMTGVAMLTEIRSALVELSSKVEAVSDRLDDLKDE